MKIKITNLPWSSDRRKHMVSQMKSLNLNYEFVDCVIGKDLTDEELNVKCNMEVINDLNKKVNWFNKGLIGCTLTNQKILNEFINTENENICILEDDIILPNNFENLLKEVDEVLIPGDMFLFFFIGWKEIKLKKIPTNTNANFYEILNPEVISGGSAVVYSKDVAIKCLKANSPIIRTPDCWGDFMEMGAIKRLVCIYPLTVDTADFKSTMEISFKAKIVSFLFLDKIPFISSYLKKRRNKFKSSNSTFKIINE